MKAVLQYRPSPGFREQLAKIASDWLEIAVVDETDRSAFAAEMRDAEVLLHVLEPVTAEVLRACPCLRLIQKIGVGFCRARRGPERRTPGRPRRAVGEPGAARRGAQ